MHKHRGFPSGMPGTGYQFTVRRPNPKGAPKLIERERYRDRQPKDRAADANFLACLIQHFGAEPFERGNLDAGRLCWLLGREVVPADTPFDPESYEAMLRVDMDRAAYSFPEAADPENWKK